MNFVLYFFVGYYFLLIIYQIALLALSFYKKRIEFQPYNSTDLPFISILIAAKDEEENILNCLESISKIDYPVNCYEVLIGDDNSSDNTYSLVKHFLISNENFRIISITEKIGLADAKANVLAQLAKQAKGEYLFITDADIIVPTSWVKTLLSYCTQSVGIVSGTTIISGNHLFERLQSMEWLHSFGMIAMVFKINIPVTAVGNNMVISKIAYQSVGGYEKIPFSVTEDYELFKHVLQKKWAYVNTLNPMCRNSSKAVKRVSDLIKQRKRWMHGAVQIPLILRFFLGIQAMYAVAFLLGLYFFPLSTLLLSNIVIGLQYFFIRKIHKESNINMPSISFYIIYEAYSLLISLITVVVYLLPHKINWKGRTY